jgi:hypothetical protein
MTRFLSLLLAVSVLGCSDTKKSDEEFPIKSTADWITYEGRVPVNDKDYLSLELSMLPGNPGEGIYKLEESMKTESGNEKIGSFKGTYATFLKPDGSIEVHIQNSSYPSGIKRTYTSPDGKRIREEHYRVHDLVLRKDGDYKMIALDNSNEPISLEPDDNLSKRTSTVFTVEGTFAHVGDSSVFYEINTERAWPVSKQGEYDLAIRQYYELANLKNEGVYLKGTGFSIHQLTAKGKNKESLVLKKIISMSSSPAVD